MRHFGKLTMALAAVALLAFSALPAHAQQGANKNATIFGLPDRDDQIQRSTGKLIDFSGGNSTTTTYDVFDFGFTSDLVRLCVRSNLPTVTVYFRMANAVTTSPTAMATALAAQRATAAVSTSAAFITGDSVASANIGRALPLGTSFSTPGGSAGASQSNLTGLEQNCVTYPFRTPGLVTHIVSGIATVEAWGMTR